MHPRSLALPLLLSSLALLVGCRTHHYLVVREGAALHASAQGDEVLEQLPRYHHEPLAGDPEADEGGRVPVTFRGRAGWVDPAAVRLFSYLDPEVDGGEERAEVIAEQLRAVQVDTEGGEWSPDQREAVKKGEIRQGMSKDQVELAWGWPVTVEPGARSGGERWIYRSRRQARVEKHASHDSWMGCASNWDDPWCTCWHPGWRWGGCRLHRGGWTEVRLPVIEERRVEFDAAGRVTEVDVRRYLDPT